MSGLTSRSIRLLERDLVLFLLWRLEKPLTDVDHPLRVLTIDERQVVNLEIEKANVPACGVEGCSDV
jgi:hypothetical protein